MPSRAVKLRIFLYAEVPMTIRDQLCINSGTFLCARSIAKIEHPSFNLKRKRQKPQALATVGTIPHSAAAGMNFLQLDDSEILRLVRSYLRESGLSRAAEAIDVDLGTHKNSENLVAEQLRQWYAHNPTLP